MLHLPKIRKRVLVPILSTLVLFLSVVTGVFLVQQQQELRTKAAGNTYYVATNGNDGNTGTLSKPWRTINKANQTMQAGDTVFIRDGEYQEAIKPARSGQSGKYITYKSYQGEKPILINVGTAITLSNRSYINVDGIGADGKKLFKASSVQQWIEIVNGHYNIVQNGNFKYARGWSGVLLDGGSKYNRILNNRMDYVGAWDNGCNCANPDSGDMFYIKSNRNLVEGNILTHGGHNLMRVEGNFNVIRSNVFDNDWGSGRGNRNLELTALKSGNGRNLFEDNTVINAKRASDNPIPPALKVQGTSQIVRRNFFFNNVHEVIRTAASDTIPVSVGGRIYNNVIYGNGGPAWRVNVYGGGKFGDYVLKNNIIYKNRQNPDSSTWDVDLYLDRSLGDNRIIANTIVKSSPGDARIYASGTGTNSLLWYQSNHPGNVNKNIEQIPSFVVSNPKKADDFRLKSDSPLIDRGDYLTRTRSSGLGTTISVQDAGYFTDGFGVVSGDQVVVGSNTSLTIKSVNYGANTITVHRSISWKSNDPVSLPYSGSAPDIGVWEFGGPPPSLPTSTPTPTKPPTPTPTLAPGCYLGIASWQNFPLPSQSGTFSVEYDITPQDINPNAIVALSSKEGSTFDDYATLVRFVNEIIDVRNGGSYSADTQVSYTPDTSYHFKQDVNVTNNTYSVWVTPEGGNTKKLATDYAFRTPQSGITSVTNWGIWAGTGSSQVCNFTLDSTPSSTPTPTSTLLPGDINGDNIVNILDFQILNNNFGTSDPDTDLNGDSVVNILDFQILNNNFGKTGG